MIGTVNKTENKSINHSTFFQILLKHCYSKAKRLSFRLRKNRFYKALNNKRARALENSINLFYVKTNVYLACKAIFSTFARIIWQILRLSALPTFSWHD